MQAIAEARAARSLVEMLADADAETLRACRVTLPAGARSASDALRALSPTSRSRVVAWRAASAC